MTYLRYGYTVVAVYYTYVINYNSLFAFIKTIQYIYSSNFFVIMTSVVYLYVLMFVKILFFCCYPDVTFYYLFFLDKYLICSIYLTSSKCYIKFCELLVLLSLKHFFMVFS